MTKGKVFVIGIATMIALEVQFFACLQGWQDRDRQCKEPVTRGAVLFPGYFVGCWLGRPLRP